MPVLCDVNVLLALVSDLHIHHRIAVGWIDDVGTDEAVVCRVVQIGLLRLLNNPAVMGDDVLDAGACWQLWRRLSRDERVCFTASEPPALDAASEHYVRGRIFTPKLWTDAYLAAYAYAAGMTLVTFDRGFRNFPGLDWKLLGAKR